MIHVERSEYRPEIRLIAHAESVGLRDENGLTSNGHQQALIKGHELSVRDIVKPNARLEYSETRRSGQTMARVAAGYGPLMNKIPFDPAPELSTLPASELDADTLVEDWLERHAGTMHEGDQLFTFTSEALIARIAGRLEGWNAYKRTLSLQEIKPVSETRIVHKYGMWQLVSLGSPLRMPQHTHDVDKAD